MLNVASLHIPVTEQRLVRKDFTFDTWDNKVSELVEPEI